ncbi:NAD-dependent epimerase/dehydratase family protein [Neorhizobium sp. LjRoot104]|uniref:NAD-dependent epimerase/dehydratase family protein n=1 Tax=Neorhizobium sp. LjRoot104 TaxID=3342254 RepID=UPI003ED0B5A9
MATAGARILVTGGTAFTGSAVCRHLVAGAAERVVTIDKLTQQFRSVPASRDIDPADHPRRHRGKAADPLKIERELGSKPQVGCPGERSRLPA